ncbi:MAG: MFS transporter [Candidatus Binatia bacterium]|nr:MFS transporter [Candidatus Binatia bacterium]
MKLSVSAAEASQSRPPTALPAMKRNASVPFSTKLLYGSGSLAVGAKNAVFDIFLLYYETNVLGLPGAMAGLSVFLTMCVDAVSDPLMGSISDHFRSRFGRRHLFMYMAALPVALSLYGLLSPPEGLGTAGLFVWLTVLSIAVRLSLTLYQVPSDALAPELTDDYDERTTIAGLRALFEFGGTVGLALVAWTMFFPNFEGGRNDPQAYVSVATAAAVMAFVAILVCTVGTHNLIPSLRKPQSSFSSTRLVSDLREAWGNHSYRMILIATMIGAIGMGFDEAFRLYMTTYFWEFDDSDQAVLLGMVVLAVPVAVVAARQISLFLDKRRAATGLMAFAIVFSPLPIFARFLHILPENGDPRLLPIIAGHAAISLGSFLALMILMRSMIQDSVDENELITGERQEGVFVAAIAFAGKAVSGVGNLLGGITLQLIAFPARAIPGTVPQNKVDLLGWAVGPWIIVLNLVALSFLRKYPITRERYREIVAELSRRKALK